MSITDTVHVRVCVWICGADWCSGSGNVSTKLPVNPPLFSSEKVVTSSPQHPNPKDKQTPRFP